VLEVAVVVVVVVVVAAVVVAAVVVAVVVVVVLMVVVAAAAVVVVVVVVTSGGAVVRDKIRMSNNARHTWFAMMRPTASVRTDERMTAPCFGIVVLLLCSLCPVNDVQRVCVSSITLRQ
jgi:hypothetical protein